MTEPYGFGLDRFLSEHPEARWISEMHEQGHPGAATLMDVTEPDAPLPTIMPLVLPTGSAEGDSTFALEMAAKLLAPCFCEQAGCTKAGAVAAADTVTAVADRFVAWLRRPASLSVSLVSITNQDTGEVRSVTRGDFGMAVELKTNEDATYTILAKDNRGFVTKSALDLVVTGDGITAEIVETPELDQPNLLVVHAVSPSLGNVFTLDVPNDEVIAPASDSVNVRAGDVATLELGVPVITTQPEPTPVP